MKKHFLVTISGDVENLCGVEFLCSFFSSDSEHRVTLLHICRLDATDMNKTLLEMWEHPDERVKGRLTVGARRGIDRSLERLSSSKMSIDVMMTKTVPERYGKVRDILLEGSNGLYDAIVLGRRASYTLQWLFERPADEVVQAMIRDHTLTTPIWVCPQTAPGRKNVLLCVDGSENSYRAVDHVGYMLADQEQHLVTLLNVKTSNGPASSEIFARAEKILHDHRVRDERIETIATWGLSVPAAILARVNRDGYAAVALGLHGLATGLLKGFNLAGGTTSALVGKIEGASLWCCP